MAAGGSCYGKRSLAPYPPASEWREKGVGRLFEVVDFCCSFLLLRTPFGNRRCGILDFGKISNENYG